MMEWLDIAKGPGSVTLVTTRNNAVLTYARVKERVDVPLLSDEESWELFRYHAFGTESLPAGRIGDVAKDMCKKCGGLPLALEVIGSTMWGNEDIGQWGDAMNSLKQAEEKFKTGLLEDMLFAILKFSSDKLNGVQKKCFLYFAAFPEDYEISSKQLFSIWHAERFLVLA